MKEYYNKINEVIVRLNKELEVDIFKNSKERKYVDARSVLVKIMRDDFFYTWVGIQKFMNENGCKVKQHGTIMHLYKRFESFKYSDKRLRTLYYTIMNEVISQRLTEELINRIRHIEDPDKFFALEKALDKLQI